MNSLQKFIATCRGGLLTAISKLIAALFSRRGLSLAALGLCVLLTIGPWLRPPLSRDFRGSHILWNNTPDAQFLPQYAAEIPRRWQQASLATPLIVVVLAGVVVVLVRPRWTAGLFGVLLCVGLPATGAALWNHPGMIEFFETQSRSHLMLRNVIRSESENMFTGGVHDRLNTRGGGPRKNQIPPHPVIQPFRYALYGPWIVPLAAVGVLLTTTGSHHRRLAHTGAWVGVAVLLAVAATWPRWVAEHHWRLAHELEDANRFTEAEEQLDHALEAMPQFVDSQRHWQIRGRLAYRQGHDDNYRRYFEARQRLAAGDGVGGRAMLRSLAVSMSGGAAVRGVAFDPVENNIASPVQDLLAESLGLAASSAAVRGDSSAAEAAWTEAAELAPWTPVYWVGAHVARLATDPTHAAQAERELLPRLVQVGDKMINTDCLSMIGDAYFKTGDLTRAREMYSLSIAQFNLPKYINLHAQRGKLGM